MEAEVIIGAIKNYIFTSNDSLYKVAKVETSKKEEVIIVGHFPLLQEDVSYEFKGIFSSHAKYGSQFKIESFRKIDDNSVEGVVAYLSSDSFKGIGQKTATKIFNALGKNCLELIMEDYNCLVKAKILSEEKALNLSKALVSNKETEAVFVELYNYGLTPKMVSKLYAKYENMALKKVNENPYRLIYEIEGFGFRKSDILAEKIGFSKTDNKRISEGICYTLNYVCNEKGFTFLTDIQLINSAFSLLNDENKKIVVSKELIDEQLNTLLSNKKLISEENRIYVTYLYEAEVNCAKKLLQINEAKSKKYAMEKIEECLLTVEKSLNITYMPSQKEAICKSLDNKISVITGGPGTGKTTIIKGILYLYSYLNKLDVDSDEIANKVLMIAPTGRASKRMCETTGFNASTIHKALGYNYDGEFTYNAHNLLGASLIIIDESSMIDIKLANALLEAISVSATVVFVGDENQLPSVSPGAFLHDLIASKAFSVIRLNKVMRQAEGSDIIKLAADIRNISLSYDVFSRKKQVFFYDADTKETLHTIEKLIELFIKKGGNLQTELQVLAPMYNGVAGIDNINAMIQEKFNQNTTSIVRGNKFFKVNDKVLQLQNDPILKIMNGDIGIVKGIYNTDNKDYLHIDFDGQMVQYAANNLDQLTLAYAISIHKSQGSEYANVILPILPSYSIMLKRQIIYTGVTRAKNKLILVGKYPSLINAINCKDEIRQTSLTRRLMPNVEPKKNIIYINDKDIPFDTLGEENMENISPYTFMKE